MLFELRYSRDGFAIESGQYEKSTGRLPDWYLDQPEYVRGDDFWMRAFWELSSCRSFGSGAIGPIPWDKCVQYAERKGLEPDMVELFENIIRELDEVYLKDQIEQQKKRVKSS